MHVKVQIASKGEEEHSPCVWSPLLFCVAFPWMKQAHSKACLKTGLRGEREGFLYLQGPGGLRNQREWFCHRPLRGWKHFPTRPCLMGGLLWEHG